MCIYCQFTHQNSIFTLTNLKGQIKITISNGSVGFHHGRAKTAFATQLAAETFGKKTREFGVTSVICFLKGKNKGRRKCLYSFKKVGLKIIKIVDHTPISHNGCRPQKLPRR